MSLVSLACVNDFRADALREAILKSLNLIRFNFKRNVDKIVIKPNMCYYYHPSTGEVTDPRFVGALIDVFRKNFLGNPDIFIVESDASAMKCKYVFKMLGYDKIAEEKNVKLINLSNEKNAIVEVKVNDWYFKFCIPEILNQSDLIVNVPKMKYMDDVIITCALKNMYGCNAYPKKSIYHTALNEAIVGINKLVKTNLVMVDGLVVCGKKTKRLGLIMGSEDPVAVDTVVSKMMGISPKAVNQVVLASKEGIGRMEPILVGEPFHRFEMLFPKKSIRDKIQKSFTSLYTRIFRSEYE